MRLFQSTIGDNHIDFERYHYSSSMNNDISYHYSFDITRLLYNIMVYIGMMATHISITFNNRSRISIWTYLFMF